MSDCDEEQATRATDDWQKKILKTDFVKSVKRS